MRRANPSATTVSGERCFRGDDDHLHELAISIGDHAWGHYDLTAATGAPAPLVGLVGYAFEAERRQHLVYMGADRHIHELAISMP